MTKHKSIEVIFCEYLYQSVMEGGSRSKRKRVYERDDFSCVYCGSEDDLSIDHVIPISWRFSANKYGFSPRRLNEEENLVTACYDCNSQKSDLPLEMFLDARPEAKKRFLEKVTGHIDEKILRVVRD